uniref:Uncharacterized protein n=1 Tax=Rhizophora mucronata TaxID=61149 RepID=A0A2P2JP18_RHIMU
MFEVLFNKTFCIGWVPISDVSLQTFMIREVHPFSISSYDKQTPRLSKLGVTIDLQ